MDIMSWLGISEKHRDLAILSLTHRSMFNLDASLDADKIVSYHNTGHSVFEALLVKFISQNYSLSVPGLIYAMQSSKSHSIIYERLKLNDLAVVNKNVNEEKVILDLVYQFFGFLYLEMSFEHAYEIFTRAFTKEDVILTPDYLSVVNALAKGEILQFDEIETGGTIHEPYYKYRLTFCGKQVCATASSKKAAKKLCAKLYCEKYVSQKDMLNAVGYNKKESIGKRKYKVTDANISMINKTADKWNFLRADLYNALVNKFLYNEYTFKDCSQALTIGGFYEMIILEKMVYRLYSSYDSDVQSDIVDYLSNNNRLFESIVKAMELDELFILKDKVSSRVPIEVIYKESVRLLTYSSFENNNVLFFKMYEKIIISLMQGIDPYLLDPVSKVHEMYGKMKEKKPDIIVNQKNDSRQPKFVVLLPITFSEKTIYYQGEAENKTTATKSAYEKFWLYIYNSLNEVFTVQNTNRKYEWFFDVVSNHMDWFEGFLKEINHPIHKAYMQNDYTKFLDYFCTFYSNIKIYNGGEQLLKIKEKLLDKMLTIKVGKNDTLLYSIWEYMLTNDEEKLVLTEHQLDEIVALSENTWKNMLEKNGRLIRNISAPNEEMQMIAIQQCSEAINYIDVPTDIVVQHVYKKERIDGMELRPQIVRGLIEVKKQEIEQFVMDFKNSKHNLLLLEQHSFDLYLRAILELYKIKKFYVACGFVYSSGIRMLRSEIDSLLKNGTEIKILAGNLQHYFSEKHNVQMDKDTAKQLHMLIQKGVELKTITDCFYHGKLYFLVGDEVTFVIVGSTNMSRNAFRFNNEFDNMFIYSNEQNAHMFHFNKLWDSATLIETLDETRFATIIETTEGEQLTTIDINATREKIRKIDDEGLQKRLLTWLEYNPSNIYDKLDVAGREYIAIEYAERKMIVLESFFPGNSYFVFYNSEIKGLIKDIEGKTKTDIFELCGMEKRGYHIREQLKLEIKIKSYFL